MQAQRVVVAGGLQQVELLVEPLLVLEAILEVELEDPELETMLLLLAVAKEQLAEHKKVAGLFTEAQVVETEDFREEDAVAVQFSEDLPEREAGAFKTQIINQLEA